LRGAFRLLSFYRSTIEPSFFMRYDSPARAPTSLSLSKGRNGTAFPGHSKLTELKTSHCDD
jgi:hypothetical protein